MSDAPVAIVGAGRMGQGLALTLLQTGREVTVLARSERPAAMPLIAPEGRWNGPLRGAGVILIATPDAAIGTAAAALAASGAVGDRQTVLHLSGLLGREALEPLAPTGAALGSFHPLQTIADPTTAPERLPGAFAGVEGDERALVAAESLARAIGMRPVRIPSGGKPYYHLGATFVANYSAVLLGVGESLALRAGVDAELAAELYRPLLAGAAANLVALGPVRGLTGVVRRGDVATIEAHLARLEGDERQLYCDLGKVALKLAREAGLDTGTADAVATLLGAAGAH